jgi:HSP20 family protein
MTFDTIHYPVPAIMGRSMFNQIFDQFFEDPKRSIKRSTEGYPVTDIYTNDNHDQIIEMALAGFKKEDLIIDVKDNTITISCNNPKEEKHQRRRIAKRSFEKTFVDYYNQLDFKKTEAEFIDGLLSVTIPKIEEKKPTTINIK